MRMLARELLGRAGIPLPGAAWDPPHRTAPHRDAAAVAACLDLLVREEAATWPDAAEMIPPPDDVGGYRQAAVDAAGVVESLIFR
jgi:hypothetical protein